MEKMNKLKKGRVKIHPCIKCGSIDIELWDDGYSSFNCGGGTCKLCGEKVYESTLGCFPTKKELADIWNEKNDKMKVLAKLEKNLKSVQRNIKKIKHGARKTGENNRGHK